MSEHLIFKEIMEKCVEKYKEYEWFEELCDLESKDLNTLSWLKEEVEPLFKDKLKHKPEYNLEAMLEIVNSIPKETIRFFIKYLKLVKEYPELIPLYMFHWITLNPEYIEFAEFNSLDELDVIWKNRWKDSNSLKDISYQDLEEFYSPYVFGPEHILE